MPLRWGGKHGVFGIVSAVLAVKLLVKKGLILVDDVLSHYVVHAPLELLLVELPFAVFGTVGGVFVSIFGLSVPPSSIGLIIVYPLLVVLVTLILEGRHPRLLLSYWLGATVITSLAVAASLGISPDPAGAGSGLAYHLENHTVAIALREATLALGGAIAAAAAFFGADIDESIGIIVAVGLVAVLYGIVWELTVGHE